jgi:putative transposase
LAGERRAAVEVDHRGISVVRQCELLDLNRSTFYRKPSRRAREASVGLMSAIDEIYTAHPFKGARRISSDLKDRGIHAGRKRVRHLMRLMGLEALCPRPNTSRPGKDHARYPYLLRGLPITRPNQVWASDITYVRMPRGWCYLTVIMDWYSRKVLSWRLSNTLDPVFCVEALEEALSRYGKPGIFNTDQGSQYTGSDFIGVLQAAGIRISMDGKGRALDNAMVERLWRTVKYEEIYLKSYADMVEARRELGRYLDWYNRGRKHSSLGDKTPDAANSSREIGNNEAA